MAASVTTCLSPEFIQFVLRVKCTVRNILRSGNMLWYEYSIYCHSCCYCVISVDRTQLEWTQLHLYFRRIRIAFISAAFMTTFAYYETWELDTCQICYSPPGAGICLSGGEGVSQLAQCHVLPLRGRNTWGWSGSVHLPSHEIWIGLRFK